MKYQSNNYKNTNRLEEDKYYTSNEDAQYCINIARRMLKGEKISEVVEPSAGNGVFSKKIKNCIAYDIEPEDESVIKQDFLKLDIPYKKGRLFIGNPPFGNRNSLALKFYKKCIKLGDFIAFILPISQLDNQQKAYEFDLIYSEDLGKRYYTDRKIHCCFNIFKRPVEGLHDSPPNYSLTDIDIVEYRRGSKDVLPESFDFSLCTWGDGSCGKIPDFPGQYAQEHYIIVKNKNMFNTIRNVFENTDWNNLVPSVSSKKLQTWRIYKHFKDNISEIQ